MKFSQTIRRLPSLGPTLLALLLTGCHLLPVKRLLPRPKSDDTATTPVDQINRTPIDSDGTCGDRPPQVPQSTLRLMTNTEYDRTTFDLLGVRSNVAGIFPPDAMGNGFDTGAIRSATTSLIQMYLESGQNLGAALVEKETSTCAAAQYKVGCTGEATAKFAERAFRRPLLDDERRRWTALPAKFVDAGHSPKNAYTAALSAVLVAPQFLYHHNLASQSQLALRGQFALATRLSYALWATLPDSDLLTAAASGRLTEDAVLVGEVNRLATDLKALGFLRNFVGQWLGLRGLSKAPAAHHVDDKLLADFEAETQAFFADFLTANRNISLLLDARFSFVNDRLAGHYGLSGNFGKELSRTELDGIQRGGLLTHGSFLLQTSNPDGTSPVKRGKWILERLLCSPPPAPPPGLQTVLAPVAGSPKPMRQRLATHRANAQCASCHSSMDPMGLGLENYDTYGKWRDRDDFGPIDASGVLPDGREFSDAKALAQVIKDDEAFANCLATKLGQYMLGRLPNQYEQCMIQKVAVRSKDQSYGLRNLVVDLSRALIVEP
ncbi:MAG: DUF1588 domain-containing protein [Deltaproteobacteria bacterium]|nr:DUF1588 domain-containing protein [Deltaproteobacteria bacterium]